MPDSQQAAEVAKQAQEHLSWWQVLMGGSGGLVVGRLLISFLRRLGFSDSLAGAEARMRQELMGELEAARKRLVDREAAHAARIAEIEKARDARIEELQTELDGVKQENLSQALAIAGLEARLPAPRSETPPEPLDSARPTSKTYRSPGPKGGR